MTQNGDWPLPCPDSEASEIYPLSGSPFTIGDLAWLYRVEYTAPGQRPVAKTYKSEDRLETGHWIAVEGTYLVVERVKPGKRGDPYDGIALCKPAIG